MHAWDNRRAKKPPESIQGEDELAERFEDGFWQPLVEHYNLRP